MTLVHEPTSAYLTKKSLIMQWGAFLGAALLATLLLDLAHFPSALLLGPMLVAILFGVAGSTVRMPRLGFQFAQGVAGCLIAQDLTPSVFQHALEIWPAVIIFVLLTLCMACFIGWIVGRLTSIDGEVAIWGFLPGMAGAVIAMSHERGLDSRIVAFIQVVRLVAVIVMMSIVSRIFVGAGGPQPATVPAYGAALLVTLLVAATGPLAARFLSFIPAGATLVPLCIGAVLQGSGFGTMMLPQWLLVVAYLVIGGDVGLRFTPPIIRHALNVFFPVLLAAISLMLLCAFTGLVLSIVVEVDFLTAALATVPGSIESIAIIAVNSNADVSFIMTLQVVRLFAVLLLGPILAQLICSIAFPSNPKSKKD